MDTKIRPSHQQIIAIAEECKKQVKVRVALQ